MAFSAKARNSKVRSRYDDYVPRPKGLVATAEEIDAIPHIQEVAEVMGLESRHISHAILRSPGYVRVADGKYYTTDEHHEGWDAEKARQALREHMAGLQAGPKANKTSTRSREVVQLAFEDWSLFHSWEAICQALEELGANSEVERQDVTKKIRPKLAEHGVTDTEQVGATLPIISRRTGWVAIFGANPHSGWYLTEDYFQTSPLDRARILSQWDEKGNLITLAQPIYEEKPMAQPAGNLVAVEDENLVVHRFEWEGEPFGAPSGTRFMVEARLPKEMSAQERLGSFQFIMKLREDLLNLI